MTALSRGQTIEWNGSDNAGRPLPGGAYVYQATLGDISRTGALRLIP